MKFEYLDHTADVMFRAYGKSLEEKFANAVLAFTNIMADVEKVEKRVKRVCEVEAKDDKSKLFDLVDELIFFLDTEGLLFSEARITIEGNNLRAELFGDDCNNYRLNGDVKAPTYNYMEINDEYLQMVVDI
ncbi:MAG: archease [Nanobdellota archaeon]